MPEDDVEGTLLGLVLFCGCCPVRGKGASLISWELGNLIICCPFARWGDPFAVIVPLWVDENFDLAVPTVVGFDECVAAGQAPRLWGDENKAVALAEAVKLCVPPATAPPPPPLVDAPVLLRLMLLLELVGLALIE